jgi:hypothetical protein
MFKVSPNSAFKPYNEKPKGKFLKELSMLSFKDKHEISEKYKNNITVAHIGESSST